MSENTEKIYLQNITTELKKSYIDYAMSVIVSRALPESKDGLKPVQRRILFSMYKMGLQPSAKQKKVAAIVGDVLGKYHPHGDSSVSDALVRMGQDFNMRYKLIDGQGNFGSIDGDPAAAMRYIEARLDKIGSQMLEDIDKKTVDFIPNYDGTELEPKVLPSSVPNLLLNGAEGIAVGMATKIPPHNLSELIDSLIHLIKSGNIWDKSLDNKYVSVDYRSSFSSLGDIEKLNPNRFAKFLTNVPIKEIFKFVKGPDFPTGGEIYDKDEIFKIYETGRGRVLMRGISRIEESVTGKCKIIISELPYQVNKSRLIARIAELCKDKKIEGVSDLRDESNREGIRIVVELKKEAVPKIVENQLYKFTELQKTFSANILALVDGEPTLLDIKKIFEIFLSHRLEIITKKNEFELAKLKEREHILSGLLIALDHIEEIIRLIRGAKDADVAKESLMQNFSLSEIQSQAILDMQLRKLAALERLKIETEYNSVIDKINQIYILLENHNNILSVISLELEDIKAKLGDNRKTKIISGQPGEILKEDLIENEDTYITISKNGYVKRVNAETYKSQKRGGVGVKAMSTKDDDSVRHIFYCKLHDDILLFSNKGKVYSIKAYSIPEFNRNAKGIPLVNLINTASGELITSVLTKSNAGFLLDEDEIQEDELSSEKYGKQYKFLFMATKKGVVKKSSIDEYTNIRSSGLITIKLDPEDELVWVRPTNGENDVLIVSEKAKCIFFNETNVTETGRASRGVRGIKLKDDEVISMDIVRKKEMFVLTISENGFGKLTEISKFSTQKRGGTGVYASKVTSKTGKLVVSRLLDHPQKELLIISQNGLAVRIPTDNLPILNRQTSGVKLMKIKGDDKVAASAII